MKRRAALKALGALALTACGSERPDEKQTPMIGYSGGTHHRFSSPPSVRRFYVSTSGNDLNSGSTSADPWRSLTKLATVGFLPGDQVYLKAGDTFTGEVFQPTGSGTYAKSTFDSTYSAALAAYTLAYQNGSVYTNFYNTMIAAGKSSGTAAAYANEYCTRRAISSALVDAHAAADAASNWITVTSYGAGANPKIAPGGGASTHFAVYLPHTSFTGGWKFVNIDMRDAYCSGFDCELSSIQGLMLEGCTLGPNGGMSRGANGQTFPVGGYDWYCSTGCHILGSYVYVKDCTFPTNDVAFGVRAGSYNLVLNPQASNSIINSAYFDFNSYSMVKGGRISYTGTTGYSLGTSGLIIAGTDYVIFDGVEVDHTTNPVNNVDGVAIDLENTAKHTSIFGCNLHDNADGAFLCNNSSVTQGTYVVDNTMTNNGLKNPQGTGATGKFYPNTNDPIVWARNATTRAHANQKLFYETDIGFTDTPRAIWTYGSDNTVS